MQYKIATGIILKSILFQEKERILNIYTSDYGMCNFIVKNLSFKKPHLFALTTPLTLVEMHYTSKNADWLICKEGVIIDPFSDLRNSYETLDMATQIAKTLCDTLLPKSPNPKIFDLLNKFLKFLPQAANKEVVSSHFLLKILSFEGLIQLSSFCNCSAKSFGLKSGQSLCFDCGLPGNWFFEDETWNFILELSSLTSYKELLQKNFSRDLYKQVSDLYYYSMDKPQT